MGELTVILRLGCARVKTRKEPCLTLLNEIISLFTGLGLAFGTYRRLCQRMPGCLEIGAARATAPGGSQAG